MRNDTVETYRFTFRDGFVMEVTAFSKGQALIYVHDWVAPKHDGLILCEFVSSLFVGR